MRRRMLSSMVGVAAVGIMLFALPLGIALGRVYKSREITLLEREATRAVIAVPDRGLAGADRIKLPSSPHGVSLGIYNLRADLVAGVGPAHGGRDISSALTGHLDETSGGSMSVAVPIADEQTVIGAARAGESMNGVRARTYESWAAMLGVGLLALAVAALLARRQARRLVLPITDIEALAVRLGEGEFSARIDPHDVPELAQAANALNRTAMRLGELITRERSFTADVSHQLATPLTGLRLGLESALLTPGSDKRVALQNAVAEVERLQRTVATLFALARDAPLPAAACDVERCCTEIAERHRASLAAVARDVRLDVEPSLSAARCAADALREVLEVLVDNAERHGRGLITIRARALGPGIVIEVEDEGPGITEAPEAIFERRSPRATGHGIGLALARAVADAHGARLRLTRPHPHPIFSIMLVSSESATDDTVPVVGLSERAS